MAFSQPEKFKLVVCSVADYNEIEDKFFTLSSLLTLLR